jgi:hypothetical protein
MPSYVEAVCIVFPSGETVWCEKKQELVSELTDKWVRNNPRYGKDTPCSMSAVAITMPREDFEKVRKRSFSYSVLVHPSHLP